VRWRGTTAAQETEGVSAIHHLRLSGAVINMVWRRSWTGEKDMVSSLPHCH